MGLRSVNQPQKYGLTLAVGTAEVELTNMTNAYAAFADGGDLHQQILIKEVQDKGGKRIFKAKDQKHRVRSQQASFIVSSILSDNAARAPLYGSALNLSGRPAAVKTGTTNDNVDAWTIGYTPQAVVGVWVGNNEHEAMVGLAGGSAAGVIWRQTMTEYLRSEPVIRFETPKNIVQISVCRGSGARASSSGGNTYSEYFIQGTEPTATCNATQQPKETPKKKHDDKKADDEKKKDDKKDAGQEPPEPTEPEPDNPPEDPTDPTDPDDPDDPGTPPPVQ
jgi:membrane peptidoglycan carboxypeptidase